MSMPRPTRCSRTRGKKGDRHPDPEDPPRRRANKRRGHGSYDNDRPPIVGSVVGRHTGEVRLRVIGHTDKETLVAHVHLYTAGEATIHTDEWHAYERIVRKHRTVRHGIKEWARDDDGDGIREVHVNTIEGLWTTG
jgi:transposase